MNSFRFCLASLLLSFFVASAATAQFESFPEWVGYDSTFYIGSDVAANVEVAMEELTIDYHWGYHDSISGFRMRYQNPQGVGDSVHREFVLAAKERGFKIIIGPIELRTLVNNAPVMEHYPAGNSPWMTAINGLRLPALARYNTNVTPHEEIDDREIFFAFNAAAGIGTQLIASWPRFSIQAMNIGDPWLFNAIGSPDYSRDVRVSVKLFTDVTDSVFADSLENSDTIAYVVLLRRYLGHGQSTSSYRWDIWERFDTIAVTKDAYNAASIDGVNNFREVGRYYKLDSLASSLRGRQVLQARFSRLFIARSEPDRSEWGALVRV